MLWRLLSRLGRGAARLPGGEAPPAWPRPPDPVPPPRAPPWQQEAGGSSSNSSRGEHQQHEHGCWILHHCASLGAFTWGVLAVLSLELAKQIQWLNTVQPSGRCSRLCPLEGRLTVLPLHPPHAVPPAAAPAPFSGGKKPHFFVGADCGLAPEQHCSSRSSPPEECSAPSETGDVPSAPSCEPASVSLPSQGSVEQKSFHEAASQVQQAFQASISLALNILGLEHLQSRQDAKAFSFFKLAADQNYSKAQFNVGLCYEHGRGTEKDMTQAVLYYKRAARQGHAMAQDRYAKWLLQSGPRGEEDGRVQEAAAAGLSQAQASLGVLGLKIGRETALKHTPGAATAEDSLSLRAARKHSQQAGGAETKPARERMPGLVAADLQSHRQPPVALRPVFSSPSLHSPSQPPFSHGRHPLLDLIHHSRSTGNLGAVACLPRAECFSLGLQPFACSSGIAVG